MEKMNRIEKLQKALAEVTTDESKEFLTHEIELARKRSEKRKSYKSKNDGLNRTLMEAILNFMEPGKTYTVRDLNQNVPELADYSGNKVSALVTKLKEAGTVTRTEVKGRAYFKIKN